MNNKYNEQFCNLFKKTGKLIQHGSIKDTIQNLCILDFYVQAMIRKKQGWRWNFSSILPPCTVHSNKVYGWTNSLTLFRFIWENAELEVFPLNDFSPRMLAAPQDKLLTVGAAPPAPSALGNESSEGSSNDEATHLRFW